jgi:hypothetical protein
MHVAQPPRHGSSRSNTTRSLICLHNSPALASGAENSAVGTSLPLHSSSRPRDDCWSLPCTSSPALASRVAAAFSPPALCTCSSSPDSCFAHSPSPDACAALLAMSLHSALLTARRRLVSSLLFLSPLSLPDRLLVCRFLLSTTAGIRLQVAPLRPNQCYPARR